MARFVWLVFLCGIMVAALTSCGGAVEAGRIAHGESMPTTEQAYWVEEIATGLNLPRAIAWLPNGDMLLTQWEGKIRVLRDGKIIADVAGAPAVVTGHYDGLRDIELDPDFARNHLVYLTYTDGTINERHGKVFRARLEGNRLVDGKVIFTAQPAMPPGGPIVLRILFMQDETLLVGVGSGDQGNIALVQRTDNHMGKIIRINRDGSVPADNPFLQTPGALPEIWALGLRNPSGFVRSADGHLWTVDIGPRGGDEINELQRGANYGWPFISWGFDYSGKAMSNRQSGGKGFVDPVLVWSPSLTPSDIIEYRGNTYPAWNGDLFVTGLSGQTLRRLRIERGMAVLQETLLAHLQERLRSVHLGPDNMLYLLTDAYGKGRILRLRPGAPGDDARVAKALFDSEDYPGRYQGAPDALNDYLATVQSYKYERAEGEKRFAQHCAGCHAFRRFSAGRMGPDLNGINGRRSGELPEYEYSAAFTDPARQIVWNALSLYRFLQQPQAYFAGTRMSIPPVPLFDQIHIVDFLTDGDMNAHLNGPDGTANTQTEPAAH